MWTARTLSSDAADVRSYLTHTHTHTHTYMYRGADNNLTIRSQSRYKIWNYLRVRGLMWKRVWKMSSIASSSCTAAAAATCHNPIKDKVSPCTFTSSSSWDYFHIQITIRARRSTAEWSNVHYTTLTENQTWKAHRDERNEPVFFFFFLLIFIYLFVGCCISVASSIPSVCPERVWWIWMRCAGCCCCSFFSCPCFSFPFLPFLK